MTRRYFSSIAQRTTLASSCTDSGTTIVVTAATGFPSSVPFNLVLDPDTVNEEIVTVTSRVGTTCTVTRAVDSTAGVAHSAGAGVRHSAVGQDFNEASEHVNETTTAHGLTLADVITTSNTKTLTNKTLTTPTIASMVNANHDHSAGAGGGVLPASSVLNRPINDQSGTTYTFALADARKHVIGSNAGTKTFTIPLQAAVTWLSDARIIVTNTGSGVMTLAITATGTLNGSDLTLAQGESAALLRTASDVWWCLPFSSASSTPGAGAATGGTQTSYTGYGVCSFTSNGTLTVGTAGMFDVLVVGGGGGGAGTYSGGGGGGAVRAVSSVYLAAGAYPVVVGAGGVGVTTTFGNVGGSSSVAGILAVGGGAGRKGQAGEAGASGSGGAGNTSAGGAGLDGYAGGAGASNGPYAIGGGGGGAGAVGSAATTTAGGAGGAGASNSFRTGSAVTYGGGGGGGTEYNTTEGAGGSGGGGAGGDTGVLATSGTANTGGGGGGGGSFSTQAGGSGGSGIVVVRFAV